MLRRLTRKGVFVQIFQAFLSEPWRKGFIGRLSRKTCEFYLPFVVLWNRKRFDFILSWSMRLGVVYGLLNRFFGSRNSPVHILRDFHINPIRRDGFYRIRIALLRMAVPGIDCFLCTSSEEARIYSEMFGIPPERVLFFPDAPPSRFLEPPPEVSREGHVFAYGNSDRDFNVLVEAVRGLDVRCVVLSQNFRAAGELPSNVRIIGEYVSEECLIRLICSSSLVVLPLTHGSIAAGQNTMLETLALGRPLLVSENPATLEYARDGVSAYYFKSGDVEGLRNRLLWLLDHPESAEAAGRKGREAVVRLIEDQVERLVKVFDRFRNATGLPGRNGGGKA